MPATMKVVQLEQLPTCQMCPCHCAAVYDTRTKAGPWGYLCEACMKRYGVETSVTVRLELHR